MNWYENTVKMRASDDLLGSREFREMLTNFEGVSLVAYQDSVGVWTIGFGSTKGVRKGDKITMERAEELLAEDVKRFEVHVNEMVEVPLTQYQFDALLSFTFNLGQGTLSRSTLLKKLNEGLYEDVPDQILRYHYAGGKDCHLPSSNCYGIVRRRKAEAVMFSGGNWKGVALNGG